jgi:carbon storage regulator
LHLDGGPANLFSHVLNIEYTAMQPASGGTLLVLTRRINQSIMIGDEIEISILSVAGEKIRIGIDAPGEVPVFRKEVWLRIAAERNGEVGASAKRS